MSELGLELEERDGGIFVTEVQEHGCVAVHGMLTTVSEFKIGKQHIHSLYNFKSLSH